MDVGLADLFASRLAPTGETRSDQEPGRLSGHLVVDVDLGRPVNHAGRPQALRSGHLGMDAEVAALGHGWPFAAGPRSNAFVQACRALARHRVVGQKRFGYF